MARIDRRWGVAGLTASAGVAGWWSSPCCAALEPQDRPDRPSRHARRQPVGRRRRRRRGWLGHQTRARPAQSAPGRRRRSDPYGVIYFAMTYFLRIEESAQNAVPCRAFPIQKEPARVIIVIMFRIRYAIRTLAKSPLLSLVVILSLGLGIGANTAIFSLLHQMVLASLPVPHPEELVLLNSPGEFKDGRSSDDDSGGDESSSATPYSASSKNSRRSHRRGGFPRPWSQPRLRQADRQRLRDGSFRRILPSARRPAAARRVIGPEDDRPARQRRRGSRLRLLA